MEITWGKGREKKNVRYTSWKQKKKHDSTALQRIIHNGFVVKTTSGFIRGYHLFLINDIKGYHCRSGSIQRPRVVIVPIGLSSPESPRSVPWPESEHICNTDWNLLICDYSRPSHRQSISFLFLYPVETFCRILLRYGFLFFFFFITFFGKP